MNTPPFRSIRCPKEEDHTSPKLLMFVDGDSVYVNCHAHAWIQVEFWKGDEKIDFEGISVICKSMGPDYHFVHKPIPVVAGGNFKCKPSFKRHGSTDKKP